VWSGCKSLASLASLDDVFWIFDCYQPVESFSKSFAAMALLLAWWPQTPAWMSFNMTCPSCRVMHYCNTPVMLFLYNFSCSTTKALDRRIILRASTVSSGSVLFIMYAKYGCILLQSTWPPLVLLCSPFLFC
jgi:hypothetical protein